MAKKETPAKKEPTAKKLEDAASVAQPETAEERVAKRLTALARLQATLSRIDEIEILRGELPLEVENIENDLAQLQTRLDNTASSAKTLSQSVTAERSKIAQSRELLEKYKAQIDNVRNNREYDNLSKEIEYQELEITLSEKKIREYTQELQARKADIAKYKEQFELRAGDLKAKKSELDSIKRHTKTKKGCAKKRLSKKKRSKIPVCLLSSTAFAMELATDLPLYPSTVSLVVDASIAFPLSVSSKSNSTKKRLFASIADVSLSTQIYSKCNKHLLSISS